MKRATNETLRSFLIELLVYGVLVVGYFYLVLIFLGAWLSTLYDHDKPLYGIVALALIIGQGVALEAVTSALLYVIRARLK